MFGRLLGFTLKKFRFSKNDTRFELLFEDDTVLRIDIDQQYDICNLSVSVIAPISQQDDWHDIGE